MPIPGDELVSLLKAVGTEHHTAPRESAGHELVHETPADLQAFGPAQVITTSERVADGCIISTLAAQPSWQPAIEAIVRCKDRLDRLVYTWTRFGALPVEDRAWLTEQGCMRTEPPRGTGVLPDTFTRWIVGPFRKRESAPTRLVRVPSWSTVGWNRRQHHAEDRNDAQQRRDWMDARTLNGEDGGATWLSPIPLVVCQEGKHRAEMHREFFDDQLTRLDVQALAPVHLLRLRPVLGTAAVIVMEYRPPAAGVQRALLPFPQLSRPVLERAGVRWSAVPWAFWPLHGAVRDAKTDPHSPFAGRRWIKPSELRSAIVWNAFA